MDSGREWGVGSVVVGSAIWGALLFSPEATEQSVWRVLDRFGAKISGALDADLTMKDPTLRSQPSDGIAVTSSPIPSCFAMRLSRRSKTHIQLMISTRVATASPSSRIDKPQSPEKRRKERGQKKRRRRAEPKNDFLVFPRTFLVLVFYAVAGRRQSQKKGHCIGLPDTTNLFWKRLGADCRQCRKIGR